MVDRVREKRVLEEQVDQEVASFLDRDREEENPHRETPMGHQNWWFWTPKTMRTMRKKGKLKKIQPSAP
jgi:hypothetical protein